MTLQCVWYTIPGLSGLLRFKFHSVSHYGKPFSRYRPFWTCAPIVPRSWTLKGQRYPLYMLQLSIRHKCHSDHSMTSRFRVTGLFDTSALNALKMTLNTKRSKVPHIHVTTTFRQPFSIYMHIVLCNQCDMCMFQVSSICFLLIPMLIYILHPLIFSCVSIVSNDWFVPETNIVNGMNAVFRYDFCVATYLSISTENILWWICAGVSSSVKSKFYYLS